MIQLEIFDGGRAEAGSKSKKDCVTRAISVASGKPYKEVADELIPLCKAYMEKKRKRRRGTSHPGTGVHKEVYHQYLLSRGFKWTPLMKIGQGCIMNLSAEMIKTYFNKGSFVLSLSRHLTAIVDGVVYDTHDPSREGTRCVYGFYTKN